MTEARRTQPAKDDPRVCRRRVLLLFLGVGLLSVILAILYAGSLILRDEVEFRSGDVISWILASSVTIRDFPTPGADATPRKLIYRAGDGPAPARIVLSFDSRESPSSVVASLATYCAAQKYEVKGAGVEQPPTPTPAPALQCVASDYLISITLKPREPHGASVIVEFEEKV